jgi:signal transduction histidine kinase
MLRTLRAKLLLPILGFMLGLLLASTVAFLIGTAQTRTQLLQQQSATDAAKVEESLISRAGIVATAAGLLGNDPSISQALNLPTSETDAQLRILNNRAVVIRNRFELDVIQIYDQTGEARTNMVSSNLYWASSLIDSIQTADPTIVAIDNHLLLLSRVLVAHNGGTVVVGLDLTNEIQRIVVQNKISADLGLQWGTIQIGTRPNLAFDERPGQNLDHYSFTAPFELGGGEFKLLIVNSINEINQVTNAGLLVMVASMMLATLVLLVAGFFTTGAVVQPIVRLAQAAKAMASGDFRQEVNLRPELTILHIGQGDEIGTLAETFNFMARELDGLYTDLEAKVDARTRQLLAAADVARAASATLDLGTVLKTSVELIRDRIGFYHVSVFIVEPGSNIAVLREAASDKAEDLKLRQHQLTIGSRSLVGSTLEKRGSRVVQDVQSDPAYYPNPLLPETRSEAVFPLIVGTTLIGALDVQSTHLHVFSPDIVTLLETLAAQIAVAIHNARLYSQQRQIAEQLAETDQVKTRFLANMSHELRTPLTAIIGFSDLLLKETEIAQSPIQLEYLTTISSASEHLLRLITDLLDFSLLDAGKLEMQFEHVDLNLLIQEVLLTGRAFVQDKPISFYNEAEPNLPWVWADGVRIRQVLLNLLTNAIKFTDKGEVTIRTRLIEAVDMGSVQIAPCIQISVIDTGIGISEASLQKLFRPFNQADDSATRKVGGAGLGLSIARRLVEMHGGRIWAKSKPGEGSTFAFTLLLPDDSQFSKLALPRTATRRSANDKVELSSNSARSLQR